MRSWLAVTERRRTIEELGRQMVTFEALANSNRQPLLKVLQARLVPGNARTVRAAISFLMSSGTRALQADLRRLIASGGAVTILFGDDFHLTQSAALASLMDIGCELRLYTGETHPGYHPKLWLIDNVDATRTVIVGSSNLSRGGLVSNAEAGVLLQGAQSDLSEFEDLWATLQVESHVFTAEDLQSYRDSEDTAAVRPARKPRTPRSVAPAVNVRQHIERWQHYISDPHRVGQSQRWRGWYVVPEQGQLTDQKLVELGAILGALKGRPQYRREGQVSLGTDVRGVDNAVQALQAGGVATQHSFTARQRRDLFVRQQRLYLLTFGWLERIGTQEFRVTASGERLLGASGPRARARLFTEALAVKKWPVGPVTFFPFLIEILERVPDRRLYYDEMNLIVIHSYHRSELSGIVNLVTEYRALNDADRAALSLWADERLRALLKVHGGGTAYGRYRRKIADLLVAFGSTTRIDFHAAPTEDRSFISLR